MQSVRSSNLELLSLLPITSISKDFVSCFLVFFLFIPFLNILIKGLTRRLHVLLIVLCLMIFSILPIIFISISYSYVSWFMVIYLIGSYLRLYDHFGEKRKQNN